MHLNLFAALFAAALPVVVPAPTGSSPINPNPTATSFTFVVAGDNRPAKDSCPQPPQLGAIVSAIASMKPAFALWNGDVIYGKDTKKAPKQYPAFLTAIKGANVPVFVAPGNHELTVKGSKPCKKVDEPDPSGKLAKAFASAVGAPYGYFRYGNSAFIMVNTDDKLDPNYPSDWCNYNGFVSNAQNAALTAALNALQADNTVAHIFVFMHRPLHGEASEDDLGPSSIPQIATFYSTIQTPAYTKLSVVFSSHEHLFYNVGPMTRTDPQSGGPTYIVTGGAGAPLSTGGSSGVYNHYLTVTVNGATVTIDVVKLPAMPSNCSS
ncbi:MAG TPA: metallophosphoesterase [Thermoanaerobaculia bacterium]|nr:metallophosphoesterase [Thermoanaerobaculia bacterium]